MSRDVLVFRIAFVFAVFLVCFAMLGHHFFVLQIVRHDELTEKAKATYTASKTRIGTRGLILDRNGNLLVGNVNAKDVMAEPRRIPAERREQVIETLAALYDVEKSVLRRRFDSKAVEVVVARGVSSKRAAMAKKLKLPGVRLVDTQIRHHPKGLLANVLGFTNSEGEGAYGIEKTWNDSLSPTEQMFIYERDRKGRALGHEAFKHKDSVNGKNIYLTIDEPIQHIVERELEKLVAEFKPKRAYAIMANPRTGAIMAMAQAPSFNPNNRRRMDPKLYRNHMASDVYDPGSTMKCVAIAGALDLGVVNLNDRYYCENGRWVYAGRSLRDAGHKYKYLTVLEIIQKSSNIGTAKIAIDMGKPQLYQTLRRFGFGAHTDLGLEHESRGILRTPRRWDKLSITRFPIGQGVSVTPLQMVQAYCVLANNGRMMQLHMVDRVVDPDTGQESVVQPVERHRAAGPKAIYDTVTAMMTVTDDGGTARRARVDGFKVAGKTGTSQKLVNGSYIGHSKYFASFIGFVPARDPAFVLLVVADEPKGYYYGGTVCAPTFSRISEHTLGYLNVLPYGTERETDSTVSGVNNP
jgi:cell division protein FtsI/penicillin-binding protein 2